MISSPKHTTLQHSRLASTHITPKASSRFSGIKPTSTPRPQLLSQEMMSTPQKSRGSLVAANASNLLEDIRDSLCQFLKGQPSNKKNEVDTPTITFDDVAGIDEAKQELAEVVHFLKCPDNYTKLGAQIPKGVLLSGPPGTGKTLLAKAVAGESGAAFIATTGSSFVEMFVGVGASRVRDLFNKAKENAPCILFIDEIDAMGKSRSGPGSIGGGSDEREQTLNQLLTEMDGFQGNTGVTVIAATNRSDVLDAALLRPGRFDRQVLVSPPDRKGREAVLEVHARGKKIAPDVNFKEVAKRLPGASGADLANILNEAAITAVRHKATSITTAHIDEAIDATIAGAKKIGGTMSEKKRELVAFHEAGHAIVAQALEDYDEVQKVSIEPRGNAAGLTWFTPDEDRLDSGLYTYKYLKNSIAVALGGRVAEEITLGKDNVTTGASNDLERVSNVARQMVTKFGMSALGPRAIDTNPASGQLSPQTSKAIYEAVDKLVQEGYYTAKNILTDNADLLKEVSNTLLDKDVIGGDEFRALAAQHKLEKQ